MVPLENIVIHKFHFKLLPWIATSAQAQYTLTHPVLELNFRYVTNTNKLLTNTCNSLRAHASNAWIKTQTHDISNRRKKEEKK